MGWGDELMAAGEARRIHEKTGRPVVILDKFNRPRWHEAWNGTPYISPAHVGGGITLKNHGGCRPYIAAKFPDRWVWKDYEPHPARLYLTAEEKTWAERGRDAIVLNASLKAAASVNKRWPLDRWQVVAEALQGHRLIQFPGDTLIGGVEVIETPTLRHAAAVISAAKVVVTHEGGLHHVAAAMGRQAVVLFGAYIWPQHTGYRTHVNLATGDYACGKRYACDHCHKAMRAITVPMVLEGIDEARTRLVVP